MRILLATLWLALSLVFPAEAQFIAGGGGGGSSTVQQYYVSSSGSDSNPGTSPSSPWQTIAKVNSSGYPPNSVINLMTNLTGCFNLSLSNNTSGPLTVQSYGGLQVTVSCAANAQNFGKNNIGNMFDSINGLTLNNIKFSNPNSDAGTYGGTAANPNFQIGVLVQNSTNPNPISLMVTSVTVTGYSNELAVMYPSAQSNWTTCGSGFNQVTVANSTIGGASLSSGDIAGLGLGGYDFFGTGNTWCATTSTAEYQNVVIANNTFPFVNGSATQANNWPFGPSGVQISDAQNVLVQHNYIHDVGKNQGNCPGSNATWSLMTNGITWTGNEIATVGGLGSSQSICDQHGINPGIFSLNNTITNNYVHDTNGACFFLQSVTQSPITSGPGWSATVANNICQNARWASILTQNNNETGKNFLPALIYNNTLILSTGTLGFQAVGSQSNPTGSVFKNNIIYAPYLATLNTTVGFLIQSPDATATTFDYNDYFVLNNPSAVALYKLGSTTYTTLALWKTACSCDAHSVFADPGMTDETTFIVNGFNLNDSPFCSVGLNGPGNCPAMGIYGGAAASRSGIGGLASNPLTDYFGNPVPATNPNMGASQVVTPKTNITFDTSVTGTATTLSLTTAGTNEMIFAGVVTNAAASCTVADGGGLTWNLIGVGGTGTSIITAWEAFSAAKQTSDTITFTCTGETFISNAAMAFRGALGIHDTNPGLPLTSATSGTLSSGGANGVLVAFVRSTVAAPNMDSGFTPVFDASNMVAEYHLFNVPQTGVFIGQNTTGISGSVADVWH